MARNFQKFIVFGTFFIQAVLLFLKLTSTISWDYFQVFMQFTIYGGLVLVLSVFTLLFID